MKSAPTSYKPCWCDLENVAKRIINKMCGATWRSYGDRHYSFEDALQEAYLCYHRCAERYSVDNAKHFRALFCRTLWNCISRLNMRHARLEKKRVFPFEETTSELVSKSDEEFNAVEYEILMYSIPNRLLPDMMRCADGSASGWQRRNIEKKTRRWLSSETIWF